MPKIKQKPDIFNNQNYFTIFAIQIQSTTKPTITYIIGSAS